MEARKAETPHLHVTTRMYNLHQDNEFSLTLNFTPGILRFMFPVHYVNKIQILYIIFYMIIYNNLFVFSGKCLIL